MGGSSNNTGYGIAVDTSGNVYSTGYFSLTCDFDPGSSVYNFTSKGGWDVFISKLDSDGEYVWAKAIGGTLDDIAYDIAIGELSSVTPDKIKKTKRGFSASFPFATCLE